MSEAAGPAIEHLIVVYNPASSGAEKANAQLSELRSAHNGLLTRIRTSCDPRETGQKFVAAMTRHPINNSRAVMLSGDGAAGQLAANSAGSGLAIYFAPDGGANDMANYFTAGKFCVPDILGAPDTTEIHPINVTIEQPGQDAEKTVVRAGAYASLGATALGAEFLNSDGMRQLLKSDSTYMHDVRVLKHILRHAEPFTITTQDGQEHVLWDLIAPVIGQMAKVVRFRNVTPYSQELKLLKISDKLPKALAMGATALSIFQPKPVNNGTYTFELGDKNTLLQVDGETKELMAGSRVTISRGPASYRAVTTRKKLSKPMNKH